VVLVIADNASVEKDVHQWEEEEEEGEARR
jgi:hypothetical protein